MNWRRVLHVSGCKFAWSNGCQNQCITLGGIKSLFKKFQLTQNWKLVDTLKVFITQNSNSGSKLLLIQRKLFSFIIHLCDVHYTPFVLPLLHQSQTPPAVPHWHPITIFRLSVKPTGQVEEGEVIVKTSGNTWGGFHYSHRDTLYWLSIDMTLGHHPIPPYAYTPIHFFFFFWSYNFINLDFTYIWICNLSAALYSSMVCSIPPTE